MITSSEGISMFPEEYGKIKTCMEFLILLLLSSSLSQNLPVKLCFQFHSKLLFADLVWAKQGDEISLEYAGTNALKGDLVR